MFAVGRHDPSAVWQQLEGTAVRSHRFWTGPSPWRHPTGRMEEHPRLHPAAVPGQAAARPAG